MTGDPDFDKCLEQCTELLKSKGKDYTIGSSDPLANFKKVAEFTGMTPLSALGVYLYKHISAIYNYIKSNGQSESEPIESRIVDTINYLLLFYKAVQEKKREPVKLMSVMNNGVEKLFANYKRPENDQTVPPVYGPEDFGGTDY